MGGISTVGWRSAGDRPIPLSGVAGRAGLMCDPFWAAPATMSCGDARSVSAGAMSLCRSRPTGAFRRTSQTAPEGDLAEISNGELDLPGILAGSYDVRSTTWLPWTAIEQID